MTLYKYVVPDRVDVLERGLVRYTHPGALNDLSELRPAFSILFEEGYIKERLDFEKIANKAYESLPESLRTSYSPSSFRQFALERLTSEEGQHVASIGISLLNQLAPKLRGQMYKAFDQSIGVFSLSEVWDSGPMWAHYADQHRGFVLGLDSSSEYFSRRRTQKDEFYHLRQVGYADSLSGRRSFGDLSDGAKVFLTKDNAWSYEREWRMLAPLSDSAEVKTIQDDSVHLFPLPDSALESIIVGARASQELKARLASIVSGRKSLAHVKTFQAQVDDDKGGFRLLPAD